MSEMMDGILMGMTIAHRAQEFREACGHLGISFEEIKDVKYEGDMMSFTNIRKGKPHEKADIVVEKWELPKTSKTKKIAKCNGKEVVEKNQCG